MEDAGELLLGVQTLPKKWAVRQTPPQQRLLRGFPQANRQRYSQVLWMNEISLAHLFMPPRDGLNK